MINAKNEFVAEVESSGSLLHCATVSCNGVKAHLPVGYSEEALNRFLDKIDFSYDDGWGSQEMHGYIWYKDGTWSERREYDGSEWWEYMCCPPIPDSLIKEDNNG